MATVLSEAPEGLYQSLNFKTPEFESELIAWLDSRQWSTVLSRRVQHFGYEYNYTTKKLTPCTPLLVLILNIA